MYGVQISERLKERVTNCKVEIFECLKTLLTNRDQSSLEMKRDSVLKIAGDVIKYIMKESSHSDPRVKVAVVSTTAAIASTLMEDLDKHIEMVIPLLDAASKETNTFEPLLDCLTILKILFKSCKHGTGKHFIAYAKQLKDFLMLSLGHKAPKVNGLALYVTG